MNLCDEQQPVPLAIASDGQSFSIPYPVCSQHLYFTERKWFVLAYCLHRKTESFFVMVNMWTTKKFWFDICILLLDTVLCQDSTETSKWASHFIRKESSRKQPGVAIPLEP